MIRLALVAAVLATPAFAQQETVETANATAAVLRGLDRVSGIVSDVMIPTGTSARLGSLDLTVNECRYPIDNPSGDAFGHLTIKNIDQEAPIFDGWMIASSPALNPLEHPRYDVWVLRCATAQ